MLFLTIVLITWLGDDCFSPLNSSTVIYSGFCANKKTCCQEVAGNLNITLNRCINGAETYYCQIEDKNKINEVIPEIVFSWFIAFLIMVVGGFFIYRYTKKKIEVRHNYDEL